MISFINEFDKEVDLVVTYEWKPTTCTSCKGLGHEAVTCKKQEGKKVWVPKDKHLENKPKTRMVDDDGFQLVTEGNKTAGLVMKDFFPEKI